MTFLVSPDEFVFMVASLAHNSSYTYQKEQADLNGEHQILPVNVNGFFSALNSVRTC